ncbi:MAG: YdcF family protein [Pseudomonadota bacterium]
MDTLFFIASKGIGALLRADTLILLVSVAVLIATWRARHRLALGLSATLVSLVLVVTVLPLGHLLLAPLEHRYPVAADLDEIDGIVVLGGSEDASGTAHWHQPQLKDGSERYVLAAELARQHPDALLLFTGGDGRVRGLIDETPSEAQAARLIFQAQGVAPDRLLMEGVSRNTAENARLSHALADPAPGARWVLVTSAYHMPRAMRSFERAGWPEMIAYPVDFRTTRFSDDITWNLAGHLTALNIGIKEWVGQLAYGLTGR